MSIFATIFLKYIYIQNKIDQICQWGFLTPYMVRYLFFFFQIIKNTQKIGLLFQQKRHSATLHPTVKQLMKTGSHEQLHRVLLCPVRLQSIRRCHAHGSYRLLHGIFPEQKESTKVWRCWLIIVNCNSCKPNTYCSQY